MSAICINGCRECDGCGECREMRKVAECSECGEAIYDGEYYYDVGDIYCESCMEGHRMEADA